jgi:hypothetical protein
LRCPRVDILLLGDKVEHRAQLGCRHASDIAQQVVQGTFA